ncbi:MAG: outer membrane lipoprotein carrier protein LolA [Candidatus Omnitrophica bacterium]|nr:outer membrane lipoprotein carrier protein LolA [Candidatus Omnitrophota bacterium]
MRQWLLLTLVLMTSACASVSAESQSASSTLVSYESAKRDLASLKAHFVQKKIFTLFEETETSEGTVYFKKPKQVLWHYESPAASDTVLAGDNSWTVMPSVKQVQKIKVAGGNSNRLFQILGFGETKEKLSDSFMIKELAPDESGLNQLSLTPTEASLTPFYSEIIIQISPDDHLPRRVILKEKSGDITEVLLSDLERNASVRDSLFEFKIPDDYQLIDYNS